MARLAGRTWFGDGWANEELDRLYLYATSRLVDVTARHDTGAIEEVQKLLTGLREAWHQVASQPSQMSA